MKNELKTSCPICGKSDTWHQDNKYKPFCCERCKLIDLGEWANESRKIPGSPVANAVNDEDDEVV